MENVTLEFAMATDLRAISDLLERCGLPVDDLEPAHLTHFTVARAGDRVAGTVGLEMMGQLGLLRSLAVAPELRGRRLAHELWARVASHARRQGLLRLYLLTTTAEKLFERWGFRRVAREDVPEAVRATTEFASLCPITAAVMAIDLTEQGAHRDS